MLTLASIDEVIPIIGVSGGILITIIAIMFTNIRAVLKTRSIEQSRRELAAYVAEGSMTSDEAERLLKAGPSTSRQGGC